MPGDSRVERTLANLTELINHPTGWSPSDAHAWQAVAAEAKRVIESLDELGPDTGIEQGLSRLALLAFVRGDGGPWGHRIDGHLPAPEYVTYRGHAVSRWTTPDWLVIGVLHTDHDGSTRQAEFRTEDWQNDYAEDWAIDTMRGIDHLLDAVLAVQPLRPDVQAAMDVEANTIDRVLGVARQVADQTATDPAANTAVWDVIDRIQKLRPVDVPTEQDRAEAEADDEREAKARARAEEVHTDGE